MRIPARIFILLAVLGAVFRLLQPRDLTGAEFDCGEGECIERFVSTEGDDGDGSLRAVLWDACATEGNDRIQFLIWRNIQLLRPLVISKECKGRVVLVGKPNVRNGIDGSVLAPGDPGEGKSCLLRVEGDTHRIEWVTLFGYAAGTGLCLNGDYNTAGNSTFQGNHGGVFIGGDGNRILNSHVTQNKGDGVHIRGNRNELYGNFIGRPEEACSETETLAEVRETAIGPSEAAGISPAGPTGVSCSFREAASEGEGFEISRGYSENGCPLRSNGGHGIFIEAGSDNIVGSHREALHNILQYNGMSGVRLGPEATRQRNRVSGNQFHRNGGLGIDTAEPGVNTATPHFPRKVQIFMRESWEGGYQYRFLLQWEPAWENEVEVYFADGVTENLPPEQQGDPSGHGEGEIFIGRYAVEPDFFRLELPPRLQRGNKITLLAFDAEGNTSEFSENILLEKDTDRDGIPDIYEDRGADSNSNPYRADSDGDGLTDRLEDLNRNGIYDAGELYPLRPDTDGDGLNDYRETRGDGRYDPEEGDTDPFAADSDCDGLTDGEEEGNANGLLETHAGESDPRRRNGDEEGDAGCFR